MTYSNVCCRLDKGIQNQFTTYYPETWTELDIKIWREEVGDLFWAKPLPNYGE